MGILTWSFNMEDFYDAKLAITGNNDYFANTGLKYFLTVVKLCKQITEI